MRTGILGGTFNPPHIGHLVCAQEAHAQLELDRVLVIPVGEAPHREIERDPGAVRRAEMCELAVAADARFTVSRVELDRPGPSYTADTLAALAEAEPDDELTLILGADQASALRTWQRPGEVLERARLAVASREGLEREAVMWQLESLEQASEIEFFSMPRLDVSSSMIRTRVAANRPIRYLVDDDVNNYISQNDLYTIATEV